MAKKLVPVSEGPPTGRNENSGLIDLDALLREAPVESAPAPVAPVALAAAAPVPRAAESLDGVATPPSSTRVAIRSAAAPPPAVERRSAPAMLRPAPSRSRRPLLLGAALACSFVLLGIAAYDARNDGATNRITTARVAAASPSAAIAIATATPTAAATATPFGPGDLPAAQQAPAERTPVTPAPRSPAVIAPVAVKVTSVVLPDTPAAAPGDLGDAMRGAVGPRATTDLATPTTTGPSARTLRPAAGAVVGAINGVLPAARSCLGPDDPVRTASLTFRSDGAIARVDLTGSHSTDGCVRTALSKARLEPFADDSFTTRVTVRP